MNDVNDKKSKTSIFDRIPLLQKIKNIKHIELILLLIFAIVLVVIYSSTKSKTNASATITSSEELTAQEYSQYLENKLASILSNISGAGTVKVMITLDGGMKHEYAKESEEITTSNEVGGSTNTKTTKNEKVVLVSINGKSTPLIVKESYPDVCGVVVVCMGASNAQVKLNIMKAIITLLNVDEKRVQIMVGN